MRRLVVSTLVTLDGVIEDPGGMAGFAQGGWAGRYFDADAGGKALDRLSASDYFLCGRRTYEIFSRAWPMASGPYADRLNAIPKLVASTTLTEPLTWNATLIRGDAVDELKKIKEQDGKDITMYGSVGLMRSLLANGIVDQLDLMVCPVVIGAGQRLFEDGFDHLELEPTGHTQLSGGITVLSYGPTGE